MIVNQANLGILTTGFRTAFNTGFRGVTPTWSQVATLIPSTTSEEKYGWLGQFPRLREWVGDRHVRDMEAHDYSIKNRKFESTVGVARDHIEDDQYGVYGTIFQELGFAAATHPDELVFELLTQGFSTPCYDGQYYFDADHPVGGQSVSNMQAGSGAPWFLMDTRRPLKPLIFQRRREYHLQTMNRLDDEQVFMSDKFRYGVDARVNVGFGFWQVAFGSKADLTEDNFNDAYASMLGFRSDEDRPLGTRANVLVCGPSNRARALEVVKAERKANGATNINRDVVDVLTVEWLQ